MNALQCLVVLLFLSGAGFARENYGVFESDVFGGSKIDEIKKATVSIIKNDKLRSDKLFRLGEQYRFCVKENFEEQRLWSNCSGTLIAKNIILTAGHCVLSSADCKKLNFVFDYNSDNEIEKIQQDKNRIFKCKRLLYTSKPVPGVQLKDYAVVELDRDVQNIKPIAYSSDKLDQIEDIISVGHPLGLPKKIVKGFVDSEDLQNTGAHFYKSHMSTHAGLSGAGVYNSNLNLIGVLVRGGAAMEPDDGRCLRVKSCDLQSCPWAEVQKLEVNAIKNYLK